MTSYSTSTLTEEQKLLLKSLEEEFKDRYTEKDENYNAVLNIETSPPVYENWVVGHRNTGHRWNDSYRRERYHDCNRGNYYAPYNRPSSYGYGSHRQHFRR